MPRCLMMGFCEREKEEIVDGECMCTSEEEREVGVQASSSTPALLRCVFLRLASLRCVFMRLASLCCVPACFI